MDSEGATIPRQACVQSFVVRERQGIIWLWARITLLSRLHYF
ncbi:MAG: hypothetical protein QNJ41_21760 [Xenococcaceae cyanobacterium MO_188.B32]|nr:hypothetical protein [Xenococcaceae cyanobacterium MO_188.B32]